MPQLQLPIFPDGPTSITEDLAFQREDGKVVYFHGLMPVFQHDEKDVKSFRMFTSQLIANGTVRQRDIVHAFGVPLAAAMGALGAAPIVFEPAWDIPQGGHCWRYRRYWRLACCATVRNSTRCRRASTASAVCFRCWR